MTEELYITNQENSFEEFSWPFELMQAKTKRSVKRSKKMWALTLVLTGIGFALGIIMIAILAAVSLDMIVS